MTKKNSLCNARYSSRTSYQQEKVFRFQVSMGDLLGMAVSHRFKQHETCITGFLFIVVGLLNNAIQKLAPHHLFSDQIVILLLTVCFVEPYDIGVLEFSHDRDFYLQSIKISFVHVFNFHNLDCVGLFRATMRAFFDDGIGA